MSVKKDARKQEEQHDTARKAARGTLATLMLRLVSFGCTQWTLRVLDPTSLGKASIQLELILTTVLFLSREGFRLALTRNVKDANWNVAWLSVPVATLISVAALIGHWRLTARSDDPDYRVAGVLFCVASCIEGWAEPAVLLVLRELDVAVKAKAEGIATVGKTVATVVALRYWQTNQPVTAFGLAQLVYAIVYFIVLYKAVWSRLNGFVWNQLDRLTCYLTMVFTIQGIFKHFLTEADRIVLSTMSNSYDQGVYAMGSAYGGMAARIILQPVEENGRLLWSRLANGPVQPLLESYTVLIKVVMYVGFVFSCLAVNYTTIVLNALAGRNWGDNQEATAVLSAFCVYTAFLAWNGMTEAFVYGVASSGRDMGRLGVMHGIIGALFAVSAPIVVGWAGTVGLVGANCIAMFLRGAYSVHYAADYFSTRQNQSYRSTLAQLLGQIFPRRIIILAFFGSYCLTQVSLTRFTTRIVQLEAVAGSTSWLRLALEHVGVGMSCGVGIVSLAYVLETDFRRKVRSFWHSKQD
jgi:oligosaccharide translocation protein RFT1